MFNFKLLRNLAIIITCVIFTIPGLLNVNKQSYELTKFNQAAITTEKECIERERTTINIDKTLKNGNFRSSTGNLQVLVKEIEPVDKAKFSVILYKTDSDSKFKSLAANLGIDGFLFNVNELVDNIKIAPDDDSFIITTLYCADHTHYNHIHRVYYYNLETNKLINILYSINKNSTVDYINYSSLLVSKLIIFNIFEWSTIPDEFPRIKRITWYQFRLDWSYAKVIKNENE